MKKRIFASLLALVLLPFGATESSAAESFRDVSSSFRAYEEIMYLSQGNIVNGSNGYFNPNREVTRAEAAAMLGRALGLDGTQTNSTFSDVSKASFASGYIQTAVKKGIVSGYSDGTFKPNKAVTRGEMALFISRAFDYGSNNTTTSAAGHLIARGIAQGLSNGDFAAGQNITRADYSVFLARAINYKLRVNPSVEFTGSMKINASDGLNVRTGPSTAYDKVGNIPNGTEVKGAYRVGNWTYVKSSTIEGFVSGSYLSGTFTPAVVNPILPVITANPLSSQVLVIDAGHGGSDPGAVGNGLQEKTINLDTALKLKSYLANAPFQVVMTRTTDTFISLNSRVQIAKNASADAFVSIHANAFNGSAKGTETYYYSASNTNVADSKLLATKIQNRLVDAGGLNDRGINDGNFHVLRENTMPAVLVELGFIDNAGDASKLKSPAWRQSAAQAIYWGILDYYKAKGFSVSGLY